MFKEDKYTVVIRRYHPRISGTEARYTNTFVAKDEVAAAKAAIDEFVVCQIFGMVGEIIEIVSIEKCAD